jgi:hypothetical protein
MDMNRKIRLTEDQLTDLVYRILESKKKHVCCERCDWEWDITAEDEDPYLCHMCGHRNDSKSKKRLKEQDVDEPNQFREIDLQDILKQHTQNIPKGPIKILFDKLHNKELTYKFDDLEVFFIFDMFSPGGELPRFRDQKKYDPTEKYVSASVRIYKILYKGFDVTKLVKLITNKGGYVKELVRSHVYDVLRSLSKNLGLEVGQIKVTLF